MPDLEHCVKCGNADELRLGFCFDCAASGEERAACRTVLQHLSKMLFNLRQGRWENARYDLSWAWQRLTRTGDYRAGGYFDSAGYRWRTRLTRT
jgi:hypothetical protein